MTPREEIEATLQRWHDAILRSDANGVAAQCTQCYELIMGDAPPLLGRDAINAMYGSLFTEAVLDLNYEIVDLRVDGALAALYLRELLTVKPHETTTVEHFSLRRLAVLIKEPAEAGEDDRWVFARSMVNLQALPTIAIS